LDGRPSLALQVFALADKAAGLKQQLRAGKAVVELLQLIKTALMAQQTPVAVAVAVVQLFSQQPAPAAPAAPVWSLSAG
jgi:hypothetical protein